MKTNLRPSLDCTMKVRKDAECVLRVGVGIPYGVRVRSAYLLATFARSGTTLDEILDGGVREAEEVRPRWHDRRHRLGTKKRTR